MYMGKYCIVWVGPYGMGSQGENISVELEECFCVLYLVRRIPWNRISVCCSKCYSSVVCSVLKLQRVIISVVIGLKYTVTWSHTHLEDL